MGNDNITLEKHYNLEQDIMLNIILNKSCYFPGESINGYLNIQPKKGLKEIIFNDTSTIFTINQLQEYSYIIDCEEGPRAFKEDKDILVNRIDFINFKGANIASSINIPFSFQIPMNILPSIYVDGHFIKHFICFELPGINAKRSINIIIKAYQIYTFENKLLKMPAIGFGDFYKKKKSEYKGGKVSCLLKIPKNSFNYLESIPFDIFLDCTELSMEIKEITISIIQYIYFNDKNEYKKHLKTYLEEELALKKYTFSQNLDKYHIKDEIQISQDKNYLEAIFPMELYAFFENMKTIEVYYNYQNIKLTPFCVGGLISIEFSLKVGIKYKKKRKDNYFELPIQFIEKNCPYLNTHNIYNPKSNNNNQKTINSNDNTNLNIEYNNKEDITPENDFVIINHDDFQKVFFGEKKK